MKEIVLDTETTGLSYKDGDRLVEIGCVELVNRATTGREWHVYINPQKKISRSAFDVHGISNEFLVDKPTFSEIADDFLSFIADHQLIIHNSSFDVGFLNHELSQINKPVLLPNRVTDTLRLARKKRPGSKASLDALCRAFDINTSTRDLHGALIDARLLAEVYVELVGGRQSSLDLGASVANEVEKTVSNAMIYDGKHNRHYQISAAEQAAHKELISKLGDACLWRRFDDS